MGCLFLLAATLAKQAGRLDAQAEGTDVDKPRNLAKSVTVE